MKCALSNGRMDAFSEWRGKRRTSATVVGTRMQKENKQLDEEEEEEVEEVVMMLS